IATMDIAVCRPPQASAYFIVSLPPPAPNSTRFPYTTLFRSQQYLHQCYQKLNIDDAERKSYENCTTFLYYLEHGHQFYKNVVQRSEEHTSELQSRFDLVCRLLLEKKHCDLARHIFRVQWAAA